jgi:hypothetical protein
LLVFLPYFVACFVTGMMLALNKEDRGLLDNYEQLKFTATECIEVKRAHVARPIQVWWQYLTARRARSRQGDSLDTACSGFEATLVVDADHGENESRSRRRRKRCTIGLALLLATSSPLGVPWLALSPGAETRAGTKLVLFSGEFRRFHRTMGPREQVKVRTPR